MNGMWVRSWDASVAPPAGAWIETMSVILIRKHGLVAPPAGAWIETTDATEWEIADIKSRPPRARGLKPVMVDGTKYDSSRAPRGRVD
ncbi:conserved hypothetical protein [uncultured spirochete]|uniref:Uncharacterized protein n=1 Tax=uncultured spirochete TaxID=156406 RepID=A0A3P3XSJ1_9SPIR|nr:conserved hypothetical protein [uncultured spirochete]